MGSPRAGRISMRARTGRILYGAAFCLGVPLLIAAWTLGLNQKLAGLPVIEDLYAGSFVALAGCALMLWAMSNLWFQGRGLPMNAYPPERHVSTGAYRWFPHPIYTGFGLAVTGVMIASGNTAGLWIVVPVVCLAMCSLVIGYERIDLSRRFGRPVAKAWLSLPEPSNAPPSAEQRWAVLIIAFAPWLLCYEACAVLGPSRHAVDTMLPFERNWPVLEWTGIFYLGTYVWAASAPFVAKTQRDLRDFAASALVATVVIIWLYLTLPFVAIPRPADESSLLGRLLVMDRQVDTSACAFPSFHVLWAFLAGYAWRSRAGRVVSYLPAVAISASCVTTAVHSLLDVFAGWGVFVLATRRHLVWEQLRAFAERVANSWRDWRFGPVRVINHGAYVALASCVGIWLVGTLLGGQHAKAIIMVALCALAGAGLWGQWLEASSQLSRPFGYFGGVFGGFVGTFVAEALWGNGWLVLGAFAVAAPLIQAVGRVRCLVQGCCHGRPAGADWIGIRHNQPVSRVCRIAGLGGVPLYPTALFSILANVAILGLLVRLWVEHVDMALVAGAYLVLGTCARFAEEGYRGEPQTIRFGGLAIYQWLSVGCLGAGIALTTLSSPVPPPWSGWHLEPLWYALPIGGLVWLCMGVDFPQSTRRMSRLA